VRYESYINGPDWKVRRARHLLSYGKQCEACHRTQDIEVHHRTYDRMGSELDSDLAVLCDACHQSVHILHDTLAYSTLDECTTLFIQNVQEGYFGGKKAHRQKAVTRTRR